MDVKFFENIYPLKSFSQQDSSNSPSFLPINSTESEPITSPSSNNQSDPPLRRTTRPSHPPTYLNDFVCNHVNSNLCPHIVTNLSFDESSHLSSISPPTSHVFHTITHPVEPAFYNQAQGQPEWEAAMKTELQALNLNHTWDIVKLPKGKKPVSCKWVYKIKQKADGSIERYKAGLVAKGFTQKHGIDFHETFSPVVKFTTIRSIVALVLKMGWNIHQFDVNNAFIHGELHEDVYMKVPPRLTVSSPSLVCKLKKSLYGLKQASRQWYARLSDALRTKGFIPSKNDYSLFLRKSGDKTVIVVVYVDDILVTGDDVSQILSLKTFLDEEFKIKDLGQLSFFLSFFLGLEFQKTDKGMPIHQHKYIKELLDLYSIHSSKTVTMPLP